MLYSEMFATRLMWVLPSSKKVQPVEWGVYDEWVQGIRMAIQYGPAVHALWQFYALIMVIIVFRCSDS